MSQRRERDLEGVVGLERAVAVFALLAVAALGLLLVVAAGAAWQNSRGQSQRTAFVRALGVSELVLQPAGRPPRTPTHQAVDLRFVPGLPTIGPILVEEPH